MELGHGAGPLMHLPPECVRPDTADHVRTGTRAGAVPHGVFIS